MILNMKKAVKISIVLSLCGNINMAYADSEEIYHADSVFTSPGIIIPNKATGTTPPPATFPTQDISSKPITTSYSCADYRGQYDIDSQAIGIFKLTKEGNQLNKYYGQIIGTDNSGCYQACTPKTTTDLQSCESVNGTGWTGNYTTTTPFTCSAGGYLQQGTKSTSNNCAAPPPPPPDVQSCPLAWGLTEVGAPLNIIGLGRYSMTTSDGRHFDGIESASVGFSNYSLTSTEMVAEKIGTVAFSYGEDGNRGMNYEMLSKVEKLTSIEINNHIFYFANATRRKIEPLWAGAGYTFVWEWKTEACFVPPYGLLYDRGKTFQIKLDGIPYRYLDTTCEDLTWHNSMCDNYTPWY